jgi:hypothetical protein
MTLQSIKWSSITLITSGTLSYRIMSSQLTGKEKYTQACLLNGITKIEHVTFLCLVTAQCDIEGRQYNLMESIVDHKTDGHDIEPADMYIKHGSNKKLRKTTKGWNLCVEWKVGTTSWERLVDIK